MTNTVLKLPEETIVRLMDLYRKDEKPSNNPHARFAAKLPDVAITVYTSGKVMFQGNGATREAGKWGTVQTVADSPRTKGDALPPDFTKRSVLGSDETGTGDFFGPITVAACFVPARQIELAKELGVKDSKQLTDDYMRRIAPDLKETFAHSVLTLPNPKYNEVQSKGWSQGKIKALLHNQALKHVLHKIAPEKPEAILIDQFAEREIYYKHIANEPEIIREDVLFSTKAENLHVSVACASIIARVAFLEEMDRLSQQAGVPLPKGAGAVVDEAAAKILLTRGEAFLKSITKAHFANTKKAQALASKKHKK